jgi:uncharacterized protein YndB with AHSA1/START domain
VALTEQTLEQLTLNLTQEIHVRASMEATFDALLEQIGPENETPDGKPLSMRLEAFPGGRWFRDLGNGDGHFWGHVQAIKRPTLLEITGPLFMSSPIVSNLQYRLKEIPGGTLVTFRHSAFGFVPEEYREGVGEGWLPLLKRVRADAEATGYTR